MSSQRCAAHRAPAPGRGCRRPAPARLRRCGCCGARSTRSERGPAASCVLCPWSAPPCVPRPTSRLSRLAAVYATRSHSMGSGRIHSSMTGSHICRLLLEAPQRRVCCASINMKNTCFTERRDCRRGPAAGWRGRGTSVVCLRVQRERVLLCLSGQCSSVSAAHSSSLPRAWSPPPAASLPDAAPIDQGSHCSHLPMDHSQRRCCAARSYAFSSARRSVGPLKGQT
mmetsp:Transcript_4579/g.15199  ORF Transcript_4579/g.15199 Transcript_4579/m.15199 type:complete len:226 (+) Transcript_4579:558-1235(+)